MNSVPHVPLARDAPVHNLGNIEIQQERETALAEEFYKWRKIWYSTIVKCVISMLSCEPYGLEKLRTHGLAIWVSERAEYGNIEMSRMELMDRAERGKWKWDSDGWDEATAFRVSYSRDRLDTLADAALIDRIHKAGTVGLPYRDA